MFAAAGLTVARGAVDRVDCRGHRAQALRPSSGLDTNCRAWPRSCLPPRIGASPPAPVHRPGAATA
eukprot:scaffold123162_cov66-Phaeocystis_antarctica.AAC.5